jgi:transposase
MSVGIAVEEIERPKRRHLRRHRGKSDPIDAEAAARAVFPAKRQACPRARMVMWR